MYPLPPDYELLSSAGQKQARINAYCLQGTPEEFVVAWDFWRRTYLMPTVPGFFYQKDLVESPPMHYEIVKAIASHQYVTRACPRGYAKSTIMDELILLMLYTRPYYIIGLCLASASMVQERFEIFHTQISGNELIIRDFGMLKPARGSGSFNLSTVQMTSGSRLKGFAAESRKRGMRPRPNWIVLDDPEYDPTNSTDTQILRKNFEWLLFRVLLPMGTKGSSITWPGTVISKQSSLWFANSGEDPRFKMWDMRVYGAEGVDTEGETVSIWEEKNTLDELQILRETMGSGAYGAEMLNRPGSSEGATFSLNPEMHYYTVEGDILPTPLLSSATVRYNIKDTHGRIREQEVVYGAHFQRMPSLMLVDYAPTVTATSDYSSIVVVAFESPHDIMWVLDCWLGKVHDDGLIRQILDMGFHWRPRVVGIEAVSMQKTFYEKAASLIGESMAEGVWTPKMIPIRYPHGTSQNKPERIRSSLEWRFSTNRIKFPGHLRNAKYWNEMFHQIEDFQGDTKDGNLQHDDLIDALAMHPFAKRSRSGNQSFEPVQATSPAERLAAGEMFDPRTGLSNMSGVNASDLSLDVVASLLNRAVENEKERARPTLTSALFRE